MVGSRRKVTSPLPSEEIHLPGPHPARGIYGFALYIVSWFLLIAYLFWAITPVPILNKLGITYFPSKLWAIIIGFTLSFSVVAYLVVIFLINCWRFGGYSIFENVGEVEHDFGERTSNTPITVSSAESASSNIRKSLESVKRTSINRSEKIGEIHKIWQEFERSEIVNDGTHINPKTEYMAGSMIGEMLLAKEKDFVKVLKKREIPGIEKKEDETEKQNFPLKSNSMIEKVETNKSFEEDESDQMDRGFYIEADVLVDEYVAGSSMDLDPGDDMVSSRQYFGSDDAVEQISFQLPGQRNTEKDDSYSSNPDDRVEAEMSGTIVEEMPASKQKCSGCGANFHCKDSSLPGFVPLEIFEVLESKKKAKSLLCKRCHLLQEHNFLLNVNVCDVDYTSMMSELKKQPESLILLVVDVTDLPGSLYPKLAEVIGSRKPMIVIGNKVDLLPPDARTGYMYRFKTTVEKAIEKAGLRDSFNILHTALVSAKTGYGVEDLVTEIYMKYTNVKMGMRGNVFLIGCTNAGKSTMFNALLQSDLCKVRAVDLVDRATTSIWPGTTISLLKFPVMKPSPYKLEMRRRRLMAHRAWLKKEMHSRKLLLEQTGDDKYAIPTALIQNTFKDSEEELQPMALKDLEGENGEEKKESKGWTLDDPIFVKGKWCFDTPGTVNDNQTLSLFTLDELVNVTPRRILRPRTAIVKKGESLLIGGVGRIDVVEVRDSVLLTTFANSNLPLNVMPTEQIEEFMQKWLGTPALVVPNGNSERMSEWPGFGSGRTFEMHGRKDEGCCDIVLSSIGWVMVTSDKNVKLSAFSPGSKGLTARVQPILPFSAGLRGKRIAGTSFYKTEPIEFPVNFKRQRAKKNKKQSQK